MRASAARLIERYLADYREDLGRVWATERPFELHLEDGSVSGRADVILGSPNGGPDSLDVVDYKTTADTWRDAAYALQLAVYAAAARAEGLTVGGAHLHDLNAGERRPVDVSTPAVVEAVAQVAVNLQGMRQGAFGPKPEAGKCGNCDYRQVCRHAAL